MADRRYYTKKDSFEEPVEEVVSTSVSQDEGEAIVLPQVNERYVKKDREETPQTFVVVFSGGTDREKDYLDPILSHKKRFPKLKLEFFADENFQKGGKPAIFEFSLQRQKVYAGSTDATQPDVYFLLTDVDNFGHWLTKEILNCEAQGIRVLVSNPCFEVWLYYATKKDKFDGFIVPEDLSQLSKNVKTWCGSAVKGGLQPKKYLFCLKGNIENAKANYCYDNQLLYGDLYSTNVFELGEAILPIIQDGLEEIRQGRTEQRKRSERITPKAATDFPLSR